MRGSRLTEPSGTPFRSSARLPSGGNNDHAEAVGLLGFAASGAIITGAAAAVTNALHDHALLDLAGLGTLAGGLVFFLAIGLGRDAWKKIGTLLFFGDVTRVVPATEWMTEPEQVPFCLLTAGQLV